MKIIVLILLFWGGCGLTLTAQQTGLRDSIAGNLLKISTSDNDSLKLLYADEILQQIAQLTPATYSLLTPVKYLGYKNNTDAAVELYSWNFPIKGGLAYYNIFRFANGQNYILKYTSGQDNGQTPYLFYDLLPFKSDKKQYIVLLGWGGEKKTNRKAVLIAEFGNNGQVNLSKPLMRRGNSRSASITFEYGKEVTMMLKFDKGGKRIIFDDLAPSDKRYEGYFMFYGPDGDYNALELKKGEWWYKEKVKI